MAKPSAEQEPIQGGFRVVVSHERVTLPNGREMLIDIVHHPGAAAVVPFTGDGEVVLIRQYRHAAGGMILEVPAGKLDAGEPPEQCAARELAEEAGYRAGRHRSTRLDLDHARLHRRGDPSVRGVRSRARARAAPEDDEVIEVIRVPLEHALDLVWRGELRDAKSALALIHAARHVGRLA